MLKQVICVVCKLNHFVRQQYTSKQYFLKGNRLQTEVKLALGQEVLLTRGERLFNAGIYDSRDNSADTMLQSIIR